MLAAHIVETAYELGWAELENGELLSAAEAEGFEVFVTTDRNLRYQQDLSVRKIATAGVKLYQISRFKNVEGKSARKPVLVVVVDLFQDSCIWSFIRKLLPSMVTVSA